MQAGGKQPRLKKYAWIALAGLSLLSAAIATAMVVVNRLTAPMLIPLAVLWFITLLVVAAIAYPQWLDRLVERSVASLLRPLQVAEGSEEEKELVEFAKSLLVDLQEMSRYDRIIDYLLIFTLAGFVIYGIGYLKGSSMLENVGTVVSAAFLLLVVGVTIFYLFKKYVYSEIRGRSSFRTLPLPARAVVYFLLFFALSYGAVTLVALAMGTASYVPNIPQSTYLMHITKLIVLNPTLAEASLALSAVITAARLWREVHRG